MSSADDIARMLNVGGVDNAALSEVISDYFADDRPQEDAGLFTFFIPHAQEILPR